MLRLENVIIRQGTFTLKAEFEIEPDARVAVIGPSGSGKSTLLGTIAGFVMPETGRIRWGDRDLTDIAPGARPFAMLFQDNNLFPHLSVMQNVGLGVRPDLKLSKEQMEKVSWAISRVGLKGLEDRKPANLSGGQQSRAALARVLVQSKPFVLLDEPFAALGPALKAEMLDLVAEVLSDANAGMMMVSHDPDDARRIAQQTLLVAEGMASEPTDTHKLLDNPPAALKDYLG